jgi:hypothetical protein
VRTSIRVCVDDVVGARIIGIVVASLGARASSPGTGVISSITLKGVRSKISGWYYTEGMFLMLRSIASFFALLSREGRTFPQGQNRA